MININLMRMKIFFPVIFLIISCPRPNIKQIFEPDYLKEAKRCYKNDPIYAHNILINSITKPEYTTERARLLVKIYLNQREYERAAQVLDSVNWTIDLEQPQIEIILLKTKRWNRLIKLTDNHLLKGIASYHLNDYQNAVEFLSKPSRPHDYRILYLARTYSQLGDYENSLNAILDIDSLNSYLFGEYQNLLFNLLFNIKDLTIVQQQLTKLKDPSLKECILLRIYEMRKDEKNLQKTAWKLIKNYPKSVGAYYSLKAVKPKTKLDHKLFGKVYYYHGDNDNAIKYLKETSVNSEVNYLLGRIYYRKGKHSTALGYFAKSNWAAAYYYRGRIYEIFEELGKAIIVYDSLQMLYKNSNYAVRGSKRKAFLWEDLGDTLKAVETFLKIGEKNTKFRAAMQLFELGKLEEAEEILKSSTAPEFIYWRSRIEKQKGKSAEDLTNYLLNEYPLSYYSLVRNDNEIVFDTTALDIWIKQLGDTTNSFKHSDSLHLENAVRHFNLNEMVYAIEELDMIDATNPQDMLYLSRLCAQYGADAQSIIYSLKLKKIAKKKNMEIMPVDFFKLLYPVRYAFSIIDQQCELSLCLAMIWQESLFNPVALSSANARGLMQIIPETAKEIARDLDVSSYSLNEAPTSIKFGCHYFSKMLCDFNSYPLSLAGYNAGPHRVKKWVAKNPGAEIDEFIELIPYNETKNYVKSVLARKVIYETLLKK